MALGRLRINRLLNNEGILLQKELITQVIHAHGQVFTRVAGSGEVAVGESAH